MYKILIFSLLLNFGCATTKKKSFVLEAEHDMNISYKKDNEDQKVSLKKGATFTVDAPITKVEAANKVPVIIVSETAGLASTSEGGVYKLSLKPVSEWKPRETEIFIGQELDQLYLSLIDALTRAKTHDVENSISIVNGIIQKYPSMSSAYYIRAQLEVLQGKRLEAIKDLDHCLQLNPLLIVAKNLKVQLQPKGSAP
jgi:hypothetical protein